jgi:hypothetical protein
LGSAINQATRQIGSVIGVGLVIAFLGHTDPSSDISGFVHIAQVLVAGGVLTSLACLGIKTGPRAGRTGAVDGATTAVAGGVG